MTATGIHHPRDSSNLDKERRPSERTCAVSSEETGNQIAVLVFSMLLGLGNHTFSHIAVTQSHSPSPLPSPHSSTPPPYHSTQLPPHHPRRPAHCMRITKEPCRILLNLLHPKPTTGIDAIRQNPRRERPRQTPHTPPDLRPVPNGARVREHNPRRPAGGFVRLVDVRRG